MLRITIHNEVAITKFVVEGKLKGPWVAELQRCWQAAATAHKPVQIDLTEVTFVDAEGGRLLARMCECGASLTASGLVMQMIKDVMKRCGK
ncbi:MAG TPA: STAS domain-containing protein [Blastocatellia bacterium]|nr:STAS domain-containing protein [Blastocatellia bacterium]